MIAVLYFALLGAVALIVFLRGGWEEKLVISALIVGSILTPILYYSGSANWLDLNISLLLNELLVTIPIVYVAFTSRKFWPLPVCAWQVTALLIPLAKFWGVGLTSLGLGWAQSIWAYPQLLVLAIVSLRRGRTVP